MIRIAHDGAMPAAPIAYPSANWVQRPDTLQVGYVGSVSSGKGAAIIHALAQARPNYDFHVVGRIDPSMGNLKDSGPSNLHFHSHMPHGHIGRAYAQLDVALLPNQVQVWAGNIDIGRWTSPFKDR